MVLKYLDKDSGEVVGESKTTSELAVSSVFIAREREVNPHYFKLSRSQDQAEISIACFAS